MTTDDQRTDRRSTRKWVGWTAAALAASGLTWFLVNQLNQPTKKTKPSAQQIQLVRPNQPPPPPPKPPEKLPEPPKIKEEVKLEQPRPVDQPNAEQPAPAAERLGVDATGSGASDGFGLAANPGGRDLTSAAPTIGGGGTGSGSASTAITRAQYGFYRDVLTRHVNDELNRVNDLKASDGQLAVLVWVDKSGRIERVELRDATDRQSELIRERLMASKPLREPPPAAMPQPMWILLNLRDLG